MNSFCHPKSQHIVSDGNTVVVVSERGQLLLNLPETLLSTTSPSLSKAARTEAARSLDVGLGYLHCVQIYPGTKLSPSQILLVPSANGTAAVFRIERMIPTAERDTAQEDKDWKKNGRASLACLDFRKNDLPPAGSAPQAQGPAVFQKIHKPVRPRSSLLDP